MANMNQTDYILDIIRAALPYVNSRTRNGMEVAIKTGELAETFQSIGEAPDLEACDLGNDTLDMEGLLVSMQSVCIGPEKEMLNTLLNFYKTRNLYESYLTFRHNNLQSELQAASINGGGTPMGSNNSIIDFLMTQLTPEQKSTFDAINMLLTNGGFGNLGNLGNLGNISNLMNAASNSPQRQQQQPQKQREQRSRT